MKKINIIFIFLLTLLWTGCLDLNQEPKYYTTTMVFVDEASIKAAADGLYLKFNNGNYGFNCRLQSINLKADDIVTGSINKRRNFSEDWLIFSSSDVDDESRVLYAGFYTCIQNCNQFMADAEGSKDLLKPEVIKKYVAEARFLRGLSYFYLVRIFGDVPAITDPTAIKDIFDNTTIGRNSIMDIYEKIIIPDLQFAETELDINPRSGNNGTASMDAAKLALADVYLTLAGWPTKKTEYYPLAAAKAEQVINSSRGYKLLDEYGQLWGWNTNAKADTKEHIFCLHHTIAGNNASNYGSSYGDTREISSYWQDYLADSLFFENHPADKRRDWNFLSAFKTGNPRNPNKDSFRKVRNDLYGFTPAIKKYNWFGSFQSGSTPQNTSAQTEGVSPIYRLADAYLIYAEAQNEGGTKAPNALAISSVNQIRKRAYREEFTETTIKKDFILDRIMPDVCDGITSKKALGDLAGDELSPQGFQQAVWNERGYEFFSEFKRWFELIRTERVKEVNQHNRRIQPHVLEGRNCYLCPLPIDEIRMTGWANNPGW